MIGLCFGLFLFSFYVLCFMCMSILPTCMYLVPAEDVDILELESCIVGGKEKQVPLTAEPSPHSQTLIFCDGL